jgi:predicted O-linked N-acetylglucosamine transferase (SPINDLY family)
MRSPFDRRARLNAAASSADAARLCAEAARIAASGDYLSAINRVLQSLAHEPARAESLHLLAQLQLQLGLHADAVKAAEDALERVPQWADCRYTLGRALKAGGRLGEAIEQYRTAIRIDPGKPRYFCSLGVALREAGQPEAAISSYQAALALDANNREARNNLANVLRESGREQEAARYDGAKMDLVRDLDRLVNEAATHHGRGEYKQALDRWTDVLRLAPDSAMAYHACGVTLNEVQLFEEALEYEERALTFDANHLEALDAACKLALIAGEPDKVRHYGERLNTLQPADALKIRTRLALPVVHESVSGIGKVRQRFEAGLDELLAMPLRVDNPVGALGALSFYLAYHGENNRPLQEKLGRLMVRACPTLTWEAPHCRDYQRHTGRLRIGCASEQFRNHSIGKTSAGLMAQLDRGRFEVFALNLPGTARGDDSMRQWMRQRTEHWLTLEGSLDQVRQSIADLRLDILFYQDIGMTPVSYFLAYSRLAPVQCVSFGHPDTTGIVNLDYFISNDLYEPEDAADHYTERLFQLHNLPTLAYYLRPQLPPVAFDKGSLGCQETDHLYVCAQALFKLHPEFDAVLGGILQRDPRARIILIDGSYKAWTRALQKRFHTNLGELATRISFINRLDGTAFLALLRAADVALDTIHFNGMNTSLEALAMGTPVVTLPKHLQRGRHTQAMYRQMEIADCIARDLNDYVDIAVRIGTEPDYRHGLSQKIQQHNAVLFENRRVLSEFERFFTTALP